MIQNYRTRLPDTEAPLHIDKALVRAFPDLSRRAIRRYLDIGGVYLNRKRVRVASRLAYAGDTLEIVAASIAAKQTTFTGRVETLYTSDEIVVVNKPPHLPTQATRTQLVSHLAALVSEQQGIQVRVVHRLDKETSGAVLFAKTTRAARALAAQFQQQQIGKEYFALVHGIPSWPKREQSSYLSQIAKNLGMVQTCEKNSRQARLARTTFIVLATCERHKVSLLKCLPHTGRSHQIRAQLQQLSLPVLGDKKYGNAFPCTETQTTGRHMLHAHKLFFKDTSAQRIEVVAPLPADFVEARRKFLL